MKKIFHKIASFLMAFVMLFSTMSFTIDMHYCGKNLVETGIFHKAESCCSMDMQKPTPNHNHSSITKKNCCTDKQMMVNGQNELQLSVDKISFNQQQFIASFLYSYVSLFKNDEKEIHSYPDYDPPPLVFRELYKLDESYII
ncbi:MAG: HYC_CC_PP family protein [Polaribacter sp.]